VRNWSRPVSGSDSMVFLKRAAETAQVTPVCVVNSKVLGSIHTAWSVPVTAERPLRAAVPSTERVRHGVLELMPML